MVSSAGSEAVDLAAAAGIYLDDWQVHVLEVALGERRDESWAALEVAVIVPRQNGKNEILAARELAGIVLFKDDLITHSAHRADTTLEQFRKIERLAEEFDDFHRLVKRVSRVNGHEAIELKGGRRIRFVSRQRNPGRGFSGSVVVLDEAFDLDASAIGAMIPTLSTRKMAQVWYASSPPHVDSFVLHGVRRRGREREGSRLAYFEWANEPGVDPADRDAQYAVNPAMGVRISEDFIDAERELMKDIPQEFMREIMGVADEPGGNAVFPMGKWGAVCGDHSVNRDAGVVLGVDVNPERTHGSIVAADSSGAVELVERRAGTGWLAGRVAELQKRWRAPVAVDSTGPARSLIPELDAEKVTDMAAACGALFDRVIEGRLQVRRHPDLDAAVAGAARKVSGDTWRWDRRSPSVDISPLVAATVAVWVATQGRGSAVDNIW